MTYKGEISCGVNVCPVAAAGKWHPNVCTVVCPHYKWDGVTEPATHVFSPEEIEAGIADGSIDVRPAPQPQEPTRKMKTIRKRRRRRGK